MQRSDSSVQLVETGACMVEERLFLNAAASARATYTCMPSHELPDGHAPWTILRTAKLTKIDKKRSQILHVTLRLCKPIVTIVP